MDLTSCKDIKNLLQKHGVRPSKGLGQNFLIGKSAVGKIIKAARLTKNDTVLEIGPGLGTLTQKLAQKAKRVIAVEKDEKMVEVLRETLKDFSNVEIIHGDIRISDFPNINNRKSVNNRKSDIKQYKVVGNLPFYLTAPVIRRFLEFPENSSPETLVLVVQREVGQRICAKPPEMSILAVSVQVYARAEIISYISNDSFWPQPKVDAAVIKITPKNLQRTVLWKSFFEVARAGFSQPRKQIANNLSKKLGLDKKTVGEWLTSNGIDPKRRAETLTLENWFNLTDGFKNVDKI